ncbi:MAG: hypothetical protein OHK0046_49000 [Anaerolineae bacterium]
MPPENGVSTRLYAGITDDLRDEIHKLYNQGLKKAFQKRFNACFELCHVWFTLPVALFRRPILA